MTTDQPLPLVRFLPGTGYAGFAEVVLPVLYVSEYARGPDGTCAFCHGDPINETSAADSPIARYFKAASWADTCPFCEGKPK